MFSFLQYLRNHQRANPRCIAEFKCLTCFKVFSTAQALSSHSNSSFHLTAECPSCGKQFEYQGGYSGTTSMKKHLRRCAKGVKRETHQCRGCSEIFTGKTKYKSHMAKCKQIVHTCHMCKFTFANQSVLTRHVNHYCPELPSNYERLLK